MTNPALKDMVKIGYATDVESRRKQLSTTALPYEYEIYATYETSGKLEDKKLHKMIDNLNPDLRISKNREFFILSPEDAYELLESIATISGTKDKLKKVKTVPAKKQKTKRPPVNFFKCNISVGAELCVDLTFGKGISAKTTAKPAIASEVLMAKSFPTTLYPRTINGIFTIMMSK